MATEYYGVNIAAKAFAVGRQPATGTRAIKQRIGNVEHAIGKARRDENFNLVAQLQLEKERLAELL